VTEVTAQLLVGRLEPQEVAVSPDGREALGTARVGTNGGTLAALLEVAIADASPLSDRP
jgi:hypothetical protein